MTWDGSDLDRFNARAGWGSDLVVGFHRRRLVGQDHQQPTSSASDLSGSVTRSLSAKGGGHLRWVARRPSSLRATGIAGDFSRQDRRPAGWLPMSQRALRLVVMSERPASTSAGAFSLSTPWRAGRSDFRAVRRLLGAYHSYDRCRRHRLHCRGRSTRREPTGCAVSRLQRQLGDAV